MKTFIYYSITDKLREPIGRVSATCWYNALEQIAIIKRLTPGDIVDLFDIQQLNVNGNTIR